MPIKIANIDHLVLTVADIERSLDFYERVLGMKPVTFGEGGNALEFGTQKINLHKLDAPRHPNALTPTAGSADLCLLLEGTANDAVLQLQENGVLIEQGPVERAGAGGKALRSVYFRDPDGNLIEVAQPLEGE
jgi:catechol 2,3-dioxygenase-like lactoylglutathione lyase family enzyme